MRSPSPLVLLRIAGVVVAVALIPASACSREGDDLDPETHQLARMNADIARLIARVDALERQVNGSAATLDPGAKPATQSAAEPGAQPAAGSGAPSPGASLAVALPGDPASRPGPSLAVTLDAPDPARPGASTLQVDGAPITLEALGDRLAAHAALPDARVVIRAGPDVPHARVVEVLDLARSRGITLLAFAP